MSSPFKVHAPFSDLPLFERPKEGLRTWTPRAAAFFGACTGARTCMTGSACPVGVVATLGTPPHGCDCPCHDVAREEAATRRADPLPAKPWWNELRQTRPYRE